ncbi:hypothetical protein NX868_24320 [Burkholderia thailandensis]|uniref:Lipoprotein n=3 Tax=Burkholderia thailandensis TaxID=57975 RepID=A0AAW9CSS4_BURTH|nr:hypothetical protein [Burkholderia thailandensis]AHI67833.1 hypothetical protein BTL_4030 [Burkholderia thailandensis H0587]AJY31763.1 hypothetical protein BTM_5675 [Burkholderia thailandensis 34]AOJ53828.1 hypothetical protein AQ475_23745 [Burkholderia thailandensis]AOJ59677.1 hypothetical protein AQ477_24470 [Burkholderia thailandensis]AVR28038.1 hypothetical protein A8H32_24090 [Burkholderia thailandensis]
MNATTIRAAARAAGVALACALAASASAQIHVGHAGGFHGGHGGGFRGGGGRGGGSRGGAPLHGHPDFHGRDFGHFAPHDNLRWRGGHWSHGWHGGRYAWWWIVGGVWYIYPEPIYPYPTYVPPAVVEQAPPPVPRGLPPARAWYYCADPQGYFPYVASCNVPWQAIPIQPDEPVRP